MLWQGSSVYIIWSRSGSVTNKVRHGSARFCRKQQYHFTAYFACFQLLFRQKTTQKPCRFCHFDHDKRKRWGPKTSPTRNPKRSEALADALPGWIPLRQQEAHHTNGPRWGMSWLAPHGTLGWSNTWRIEICNLLGRWYADHATKYGARGAQGIGPQIWVHEFWVEQKARLNELIFFWVWVWRYGPSFLPGLVSSHEKAGSHWCNECTYLPTYLPTYTYIYTHNGKSSNCLWAMSNPQILKAEAYGHDATGAGTLKVFFCSKKDADFDFFWLLETNLMILTELGGLRIRLPSTRNLCVSLFWCEKKVTAMHPHCW